MHQARPSLLHTKLQIYLGRNALNEYFFSMLGYKCYFNAWYLIIMYHVAEYQFSYRYSHLTIEDCHSNQSF